MSDGKIIAICAGGGAVVMAVVLSAMYWPKPPRPPVATKAAPVPTVQAPPPVRLPQSKSSATSSRPILTYEGKPVSYWIDEAQTAGNTFHQCTGLMTLGYFPGDPDALKAVREAWFFYGNGPEDDSLKMAAACSLFTLSAEDRPAIVKWCVMRVERDGLKFLAVGGFDFLSFTMGSDARPLLPLLQRLRETEKSSKWHERLDRYIKEVQD